MTFNIRLLSNFRQTVLGTDKFCFSSGFSYSDADALLCEWSPHAELLTFPGPKAWYCCEATSRELFKASEWRLYKRRLAPSQFLYHAHPDLRYRVPHTNIEEDIRVNNNLERQKKAIAIVSNTGGPPWRLNSDMRLRNKFVTHEAVDLFGKRIAWGNFRSAILSHPRFPPNYQGEVPGHWRDHTRFELMARYKVAVCFENTIEPYYFTEKFVGAVQAGCIPIYHAHKTVRETFLKGACWVDPEEFNFDPTSTLQYALCENREKYCEINNQWLKSEAAQSTNILNVFNRIGNILSREFEKSSNK